MMDFGTRSGMTSIHMFDKNSVIDGSADDLIRSLLRL